MVECDEDSDDESERLLLQRGYETCKSLFEEDGRDEQGRMEASRGEWEEMPELVPVLESSVEGSEADSDEDSEGGEEEEQEEIQRSGEAIDERLEEIRKEEEEVKEEKRLEQKIKEEEDLLQCYQCMADGYDEMSKEDDDPEKSDWVEFKSKKTKRK